MGPMVAIEGDEAVVARWIVAVGVAGWAVQRPGDRAEITSGAGAGAGAILEAGEVATAAAAEAALASAVRGRPHLPGVHPCLVMPCAATGGRGPATEAGRGSSGTLAWSSTRVSDGCVRAAIGDPTSHDRALDREDAASRVSGPPSLTRPEAHVLHQVAAGKTSAAIGTELSLSRSTVDGLIADARLRLGARTRADTVVRPLACHAAS